MGDQGFDYCEFVWNHMTIQRLMSILRQTQAYCTDNECLNYPSLPGPQTSEPSSDFLFMTLAFITMMMLYVFRPNSLRKKENESKIRNNSMDSNGEPPAPPPPAIH